MTLRAEASHQGAASVLLLLLGVPLLASLVAAAQAAWPVAAWRSLWADSQTLPALGLSLWTGLLSTTLALAATQRLLQRQVLSPSWPALVRLLGPLLALPHAAFAIGLALLISPSGWLLRALSPWATGLTAPPPWLTTQDPWGLGLVAVLTAKEVPFLLWAAASQLQRPDVAERLHREMAIARSLGYSPRQAWRRVVWPQLLLRLRWPLLAVLIYSLTVVDVALVIGPGSPPTLAVLAWQWLNHADPTDNAQGAAAAWLLTFAVAATAGLAWQITRWPVWRVWRSNGERGRRAGRLRLWRFGRKTLHHSPQASVAAFQPRARIGGGVGWALPGLALLYLMVMLALGVGSVAGPWPFPALRPQSLTWQAWQTVADSTNTLADTLSLAAASATAALCWSVAWLEWASTRWQMRLQALILVPLLLPPVLWVLGVHHLALRCGLDATWLGVALAHTLAATPYVLIALHPAYAGFDPRLRQLSASLGHGQWVFLWRVKWPLLRAALASALAVGFAVSVAQYLPTQFVGAGRLTTVTSEAVTLAAGAQRSLASAYAWLQWLLPALAFALAAWLGRPRRF